MTLTDTFSIQGEWDRAFSECISEESRRFGNDPNGWKASGKVSKAYPEKENKAWWQENGPLHVERWIKWRETLPFPLWVTPDGEEGVELSITAMFGTVRVKAVIDRVIQTPQGLAVVDLKSGSKNPASLLQLGVYACAVELKHGVRPALGTYFSTRKGEVTGFQSLDHLSVPLLTELFEEFSLKAKWSHERRKFLPAPGDHCSWCDVRNACSLQNGRDARKFDSLSLVQ